MGKAGILTGLGLSNHGGPIGVAMKKKPIKRPPADPDKNPINQNALRDLMGGKPDWKPINISISEIMPLVRENVFLEKDIFYSEKIAKGEKERADLNEKLAGIASRLARVYEKDAEKWNKKIVEPGKKGARKANTDNRKLRHIFQRMAEVIWKRSKWLSSEQVAEKIIKIIEGDKWEGITLSERQKQFLIDNPRTKRTIRQHIKNPHKSRL